MKLKLLSIVFGVVALTSAAAASAHVSVDIGLGVSPCGYPGIYQDCGYYAPPPAIYLGGGGWGGGDRGRGDRRGGDRRGGGGGHGGGGRHR